MRRLGVLAGLVLMAGCATAAPPKPQPEADLSGRWIGTWRGNGIFAIPREESAILEVTQTGARGHGRLIIDGAHAAESVPVLLRLAGLAGTRVFVDVAGSKVEVTHEGGGHVFAADLAVEGDRLVGRFRDTETPIRLVLTREKPQRRAEEPVPVASPAPPETPAPEPSAPPVPTAVTPETPPPAVIPTETPSPASDPLVSRSEPREFMAIPEMKAVFFEFDKAEIRPGDSKTLDANADWLKTHGESLLLIAGHADERGTGEYNLALGERRAKSAMNYLLSLGISADRITVVSYGEERPVCRERNELCWRLNRRSEFLVKPD